MHKLFDLARLWEYLPLERRNPIEIVKIKNVTRRTKQAVVLSPDQFREVMRQLSARVNVIAITMSSLGLRVSEALGLRWEDFDCPLNAGPIHFSQQALNQVRRGQRRITAAETTHACTEVRQKGLNCRRIEVNTPLRAIKR
jgi:integrase